MSTLKPYENDDVVYPSFPYTQEMDVPDSAADMVQSSIRPKSLLKHSRSNMEFFNKLDTTTKHRTAKKCCKVCFFIMLVGCVIAALTMSIVSLVQSTVFQESNMNSVSSPVFSKPQDDEFWCSSNTIVSLVRNATHVTKGFGYRYMYDQYDLSDSSEDMKMTRLSDHIFLVVSARGPDLHLNLIQVSSSIVYLQQEVRTLIGTDASIHVLNVINTADSSLLRQRKFLIIFENRFTHTIYALRGQYSGAKFTITSNDLIILYEQTTMKPISYINVTSVSLNENTAMVAVLEGPQQSSVFLFSCDLSDVQQKFCESIQDVTIRTNQRYISSTRVNNMSFMIQTHEETRLIRFVQNRWMNELLSIPAIPRNTKQGPFVKSFGNYYDDDWIILYYVDEAKNLDLMVYGLNTRNSFLFTIANHVHVATNVQVSLVHEEYALLVTYGTQKYPNGPVHLYVRAISLIQSESKIQIIMEDKPTKLASNINSVYVVAEARQEKTEIPMVLIMVPSQHMYHALYVHGGAKPFGVTSFSAYCENSVRVKMRGHVFYKRASYDDEDDVFVNSILYYGNKDGSLEETEYSRNDRLKLPIIARSVSWNYLWVEIR